MKQVIYGACSIGNSDVYLSPLQLHNGRLSAVNGRTLVCGVVTFSRLYISRASAPGLGKSVIVTFYKNDVAQSLSVTLSDTNTTAVDLTHSVSCISTDLVYIYITSTGSPGTSRCCFEIQLDTADNYTSFSGGDALPGIGAFGATTQYFNGIFGFCDNWFTSAPTVSTNIVSAPGNIKGMGAFLSGSPGSGNTATYTIFKNGVAQDGTAGTPDTRLTVSNSNTTGQNSFTLAVADSDIVYVRVDTTTGWVTPREMHMTFAFQATNAGEYNIAGGASSENIPTALRYCMIVGQVSNITEWVSSEASAALLLNTGLSLSRGRAQIYAAAASNTGTWTVSALVNATTPISGPVLTLGDSNSPASNNNIAYLAAGQTLSLQWSTTGTTGTHKANWAFTAMAAGGTTPGQGALSGIYFFDTTQRHDIYYATISGSPPTTTQTTRKIPDPFIVTGLIGED